MVTGSNNVSLCVITAGRLTPACPNISPGSFGALRVHTTDLGGLSAPRLGGMAPSVSLSTRVSPGLRERLLAEARARRMSIGTLARELLAAGVDAGPVHSGDGGVLNEVNCLFYGLPPEAAARALRRGPPGRSRAVTLMARARAGIRTLRGHLLQA